MLFQLYTLVVKAWLFCIAFIGLTSLLDKQQHIVALIMIWCGVPAYHLTQLVKYWRCLEDTDTRSHVLISTVSFYVSISVFSLLPIAVTGGLVMFSTLCEGRQVDCVDYYLLLASGVITCFCLQITAFVVLSRHDRWTRTRVD